MNKKMLVMFACGIVIFATLFLFLKHKKGENISPAEDLMREHGVLRRVLLIYEKLHQDLINNRLFKADVLIESAAIVRSFIEDYHVKLEEDYIFPRFEKAGRFVDLISVLKEQHTAGRQLTDRIHEFASKNSLRDEDRKKLVETLSLFIRIHRAHAAREDTVLFPEIRFVVSPQEYDALAETFEKKEHELFGDNGFTKIVGRLVHLERAVGIDNLSYYNVL